MRKVAGKGRIGRISEEFERLVKADEIKWNNVSLGDLPMEWAKMVVTQFLVEHGIKWQLGDKVVDDAIIIRTADPFVRYLHIYPTNEFMWVKEGHDAGIHPDEVTVYIINTYPYKATSH